MSDTILQTERLILRPFVKEDAAKVQVLAGVPEVALTTQNIPLPYEESAAELWIASLAPAWAEGRLLSLAVTSEAEGVLGAVSLQVNKTHFRGEIGYWIGTPFWNRGIATEAVARLIDFGFEALGLNRIMARHLTWNPGSGRVMVKVGMKPEGILRKHAFVRGKFEDLAMYGILKADWAATRPHAAGP